MILLPDTEIHYLESLDPSDLTPEQQAAIDAWWEDRDSDDEHTHTRCSICSRELPKPWTLESDGVPLCKPCEQTARAAGKQAVDAMRYPDPELRR